MSKCSLANLLANQKKFACNFVNFDNQDIVYKEKISNELLMALVEEVIEVRRCIHWKHWKTRTNDPDLVQVKEELIDCLSFLLELFLLWGMSEEEISNIYSKKMKLNESRFLSKS